DRQTIQLFIVWFFFCIVLTYLRIVPVANIAHGTGAVLGILVGLAITLPERRALFTASAGIIVLFGLWAATLGRPRVNLSEEGAYEECNWGYKAMNANHNQDAVRWLSEAVSYRHVPGPCWSTFGLANEQAGNHRAALAAYRKGIELGDQFAEYSLAAMYDRGAEGVPQDDQQALNWYRKAASHASPAVLNNIAWAFATSSNPAIRNPEAALKYATQAVAADKEHPNPRFLDTLAEAQYATGNSQDAVQTEEHAIALAAPQQKDSYQKSLAKYQHAAHVPKP